jgi:hypothetical protein
MGMDKTIPCMHVLSSILPIIRTYTRQQVQVFPIPVTRHVKWVPAGKNTCDYNTSNWSKNMTRGEVILNSGPILTNLPAIVRPKSVRFNLAM